MMTARIRGLWLSCLCLLMVGWIMSTPQVASATATQDGAQSVMEGNVSRTIRVPNSDITVKIAYGVSGVAFSEYSVPVQCSISSREDFTGTLRLIPRNTINGQRLAYGTDISVAKGTEKTTSFVIEDPDGEGSYTVDLLDEKGKLIYSEDDTVYMQWAQDHQYIGILSDDFSGLTYFDGLPIGNPSDEITTALLELNEGNIPEKLNAIKMMRYILIDNYDTGKLSERQVEVLKQWIVDGGTLVLPLGANAQNVLRCFSDDFVSGTLGDLKRQNVSFGTDAQTDGNEEEQKEIIVSDVDVMDFELQDATNTYEIAKNNIAVGKKIGEGMVVVLGYDLAMDPIASATEKRQIANVILNNTFSPEQQNQGNANSYYDNSEESIAKNMNNSPKPNAFVFGAFFLVYVIFVGPILYLILKKAKKREKIWIAIPITSLVFTFVVFVASTIYRVHKPMANTFTVIQLQDNLKMERVYTNFICPKAKDYKFVLEDDYREVSMRYSSMNYSIFGSPSNIGNDPHAYTFMVKDGNEGKELEFRNSKAFEERNFELRKAGENDVGQLEFEKKCYSDGFEGTLTNNSEYDLSNIVVYFDNRFAVIDQLKKGESTSIKKDQLYKAIEYDSFSQVYGEIAYFKSNSKKHREYLISCNMERMYVDRNAYGKGYIWASIGSYNPKIVKEGAVKQYGGAVLYQTFFADYEDVVGYHPNVKAMLVSCDGDYDDLENCIYSESANMTYEFDGMKKIVELVCEDYENMQKVNTDSNRCYASVYAYNVEKGDYEQIFVDSDSVSGAELEKYMQGNVLLLRYQANGSYTNYVPQISFREEE